MVGTHGVVLAASMAGLLAARVLAEFYESVTVVERDELPDAAANRKCVPQGRHAHGSSGSQDSSTRRLGCFGPSSCTA